MKQTACIVLDGGLATELERRGYSLTDALWSARLLAEAPETIAAVHSEYLDAGADCITTASYQATIAAFLESGHDLESASQLIGNSVRIARKQRDLFWSNPANRIGRIRPLVAASVGPYGAFLANGSEYRGQYGMDVGELMEFHHDRWALLCREQPDVMLCETIPDWNEANALAELARKFAETPTWISFSCRDSRHISDGTELVRCARLFDNISCIRAVGINCVAPEYVADAIYHVRSVTDKQIIAFPNSGETWDAKSRSWRGSSSPADFARLARVWNRAGASIIGGCCRTGPNHIRQIRSGLHDNG